MVRRPWPWFSLHATGLLAVLLVGSPLWGSGSPVVLQLKWKHQFQFAGYYAALAEGYYQAEGLDVHIVEGAPDRNPVTEVLAGRAQFGVSDASLLVERASGKPVVILAAIFQHSPAVLLVHPSGPGQGLQALAGRRVMMAATDYELMAFLQRSGLSRDHFKLVPPGFRIEDLLQGRVDAVSAYASNEPYYLDQAGFPYQVYSPREAGIDPYGDCLFTSERQHLLHPGQVKAFRAASLRGWQFAMAHPEEMADLILSRYPGDKSRQHLLYEAHQMQELIQPGLVEIGYMNPMRWRRIADTFAGLGLVPKGMSLEGALYLPPPPTDLTWLVRVSLALLALGVAIHALRIRRINGQLQTELAERRKVEEEQRQSARVQAALHRMALASLEAPSLHDLLQAIHGTVADLLPSRNFFVALLDEANRTLTFPFFEDEVDPVPEPRPTGRTLTDLVLRTGQAQHLSASQMVALSAQGEIQVQGTPPEDWLGVPLLVQGTTFGVMAVQTYLPGSHYTEENLGLLQFLAIQVAASIRRRQADDARRLLQAEVQHMQKLESLGQLIGGVAHDMNNVLGAILALSSAHLQPSTDSGATRAFEIIANAAERGGKLVKSLLGFSRKSPSTLETLDLNAIIREDIQLLARTTLAKVHLVTVLTEGLWPIRGDANALSHALMNLAINAVDAMPDRGELTFRTRNVAPAWVEVLVEDTGTGMSEEVLAKALTPFFTTKDAGKGTGLGLSLVNTTVVAHKGQLELHSEIGQGTQVRMVFPALDAGEPATGAGLPKASLAAPAARILDVLVVDDDDLLLSSTQALIELEGHTVTCAASGEQALARVAEGYRPGLVILDLNMPGLGGKGTLPRLRSLLPEVPILLATGFAEPEDLAFIHATPKVTLLAKPFTMKELQRHLRRVEAGG